MVSTAKPSCAARAKKIRPCARHGRMTFAACADARALLQDLDEADAPGGVAAEEDAVRVGRIDVNSARIALRLRQRELDPFLRPGIEAGDLVDLMLAHPGVVVLLVDHAP